jgi:dienelactone hydrolase
MPTSLSRWGAGRRADRCHRHAGEDLCRARRHLYACAGAGAGGQSFSAGGQRAVSGRPGGRRLGRGIFSSEQRAALLAAHGYAALALAYFALETLPGELVNIPLEYFGAALAWLQRQPTIRGDQLAAVGGSKGGELVLLLATCYPQLKTVVAYLPSNVVWNGIVRGQDDPVQWSSSWSWQGEPLPFLARAPMNLLQEQMARGEAISLRPLDQIPLADQAAVQQAIIPVKQSQAAILLIAGGDDRFWPSSPMAAMVMERLRRRQYPYPFAHLSYPEAGHGIGLPHLPATVNQMRHPIRGLLLRSGGNAQANAQARVDAWVRMLEFIGENRLNRISGG